MALVASLQVANAQVKSVSASKAAVESAQKAANDPKKAVKFATWQKLGQAYLDAYDAVRGNGWVGGNRQEVQIIMSSEKALAEESVNVGGRQMTKVSYDVKDYYYDEAGVLQMIVATSPIYPDALDRGLEAFVKAAELDVKGQKAEDILKAVESIAAKFLDEAFTAYTFADYAKASVYFEKAYATTTALPSMTVNGEYLYNAAFTANMAGDNDRAKALFEKSIEIGYEGEGGEAYAKLADILDKQGDKEGSKDILEKAFLKYPQSQGILIGLINYYIGSNGDTSRLFELLAVAKQNEPNNPSLWYVEGNIHKQLGQQEQALASYDQCSAINAEYEFGYIGKGIFFYEKAIELQEKANNEMDDRKWEVLNKEFEDALKSCIEPFEKAFEISKDDALKSNIAEYLKNACFRFRTESQEFSDKYEKYNEAAGK